jgi:hypothetical protein
MAPYGLPASSRPQAITVIGAHRGADGCLPALATFNAQSSAWDLQLLVVDPLPARAASFAQRASRLGLVATGIEAHAQSLSTGQLGSVTLVVVDDPGSAARIVALAPGFVALLLFVRIGPILYSLRALIPPGDDTLRQQTALLLLGIDALRVPTGSDAIFGVGGRPEHRSLELVHRNHYATTFTADLARGLAGLPPEHPGLSLSANGRTSMPVLVRSAFESFANPAELAWQSFDDILVPVERGTELVAAEVAADEMRLHRVRQLLTESGVTVGGVPVIDPRAVCPSDGAAWDQAGRERDQTLAQAARQAIRRKNRLAVSD